MTTDQIKSMMHAILGPKQITELRALEVSTPTYQRPHTESGYFDDVDKLCSEACRLAEYAKGLYFIPNSVNPELLARSANHAQPVNNCPLTRDSDIISRRWLIIDIDPVRPSGISATDTEYKAALKAATEIREYLHGKNWPDPILADSGNGRHLLYRIDLPADDGGIVRRCLEALAFRFDSSRITIDQTVHNPGRLCRFYGTFTRKGDNIPERPHRMSQLIKVPELLSVVYRELLENLANSALQTAIPQMQQKSNFNLNNWIQEHNVNVIGPSPWKDGKKWIFRVCPWKLEHTNRSAYIIQFGNGAIAAGCLHNGCRDKNWHALRDVIEPGCVIGRVKYRHYGRVQNQPVIFSLI